ncbi:MAG: phosphatase PAP2 family protein [Myxococcales bacterium]
MKLWPRPPRPAVRWSSELGVVSAATVLWGGGEYVRLRRSPKPGLERQAQRMLNGLDGLARQRLLRPHARLAADRASDALAFAAVPLACGLALMCVDGLAPRLLRDGLRVVRAVTLTGAVNQAVKFLAPRERPFTRTGPTGDGRDPFGSFFSNHTSAVTAMASASARLVHARGARTWFGLPLFGLAVFVGYLRIAADQHYLTDVLAGLGIGAALGFAAAR